MHKSTLNKVTTFGVAPSDTEGLECNIPLSIRQADRTAGRVISRKQK